MAKCIPENKTNCLLLKGKQNLKLGYVNYCVGGVMSRCGAGTIWDDQKRCKFAVKSTISNRCMYFIEAIGGHCDCVEAQQELRAEDHIRKDKR